jgi:hypothetical protein
MRRASVLQVKTDRLLQHGADPLIKDEDDQTLYHVVARGKIGKGSLQRHEGL